MQRDNQITNKTFWSFIQLIYRTENIIDVFGLSLFFFLQWPKVILQQNLVKLLRFNITNALVKLFWPVYSTIQLHKTRRYSISNKVQ